jgi:hypothetical protein
MGVRQGTETARVAETLVNVNVTVAAVEAIITLQDIALCLIRLVAVEEGKHRLTEAVRKASYARASVCTEVDVGRNCRFSAQRVVLARERRTLIHVDIAVACSFTSRAFQYRALGLILGYERVSTQAVREPVRTCALVRMNGDRSCVC